MCRPNGTLLKSKIRNPQTYDLRKGDKNLKKDLNGKLQKKME